MTTSEPHPATEFPRFSVREIVGAAVVKLQVRNACVVPFTQNATKVIVWNWRTGRALLVSNPLAPVTSPGLKGVCIAG